MPIFNTQRIIFWGSSIVGYVFSWPVFEWLLNAISADLGVDIVRFAAADFGFVILSSLGVAERQVPIGPYSLGDPGFIPAMIITLVLVTSPLLFPRSYKVTIPSVIAFAVLLTTLCNSEGAKWCTENIIAGRDIITRYPVMIIAIHFFRKWIKTETCRTGALIGIGLHLTSIMVFLYFLLSYLFASPLLF